MKFYFLDENDDLCAHSVIYDWKPVTCQSCNQLGHTQEQCRHVAQVPVPIDQHVNHAPATSVQETDSEGFQVVRACIRRKVPNPLQPLSSETAASIPEQPSDVRQERLLPLYKPLMQLW